MNILILHDQVSDNSRIDEADAVIQAECVAEALSGLGHQCRRLELSFDLQRAFDMLAQIKPDLIFNLVESLGGKGSLIHFAPALLDALGLRYTGAKAEAMFLSSGKLTSKRIFTSGGIPTPKCFTVDSDNAATINAPFIIKSTWEHASVGMDDHAVVKSSMAGVDLQALLRQRAQKLGGECFAEEFVDGREFNLALLADPESAAGVEALPPAEIRFVDYPPEKPRIVDYRAKWIPEAFEFTHTPRTFDFPATDAPLLAKMKGLAIKCWQLFGLAGYARVDFRVDAQGNPWVLEVNANPCLSPDAGYQAALQQAQIPFPEAIRRIVASA